MYVLNRQIQRVQPQYTLWEPGISFNIKKETLQMLGGRCYLLGPHLPAAARETQKARGPFDSAVAFALKSIRHSI